MEQPTQDLQVTLDLNSDEEIQQDPSGARWNETFDALLSLVNTPNTISIDEVVQKINNHFIEHAMGGEEGRAPDAKLAEHFMFAFWFSVVNVATQIPGGHPAQNRLVALIKGLHDFPNPVEYIPEGQVKGQKVWLDLPGIGQEIHEALDDSERYTLGLEELAARLLQEIDYDFKYIALARINEVLKRPEPTPKVKKGVNEESVTVRPNDPALRHMEVWVGIAGQKIYQACKRNTNNKGEVALDNTSPDLTIDLWNSWKLRIREIKADTEEPADRREMAERIESLMIAREEDGDEI
ncbi:hypothetical protein BKA70DRAFT_1293882 [Coprinopsis sp. MPI-PUGE-AT-0042]|nr:hypothetical protein BKA70DRAFT_1293882 [Coprinopsis sp. MPI-PUGE-AT-0042]